jgi:hypothetical protein
MAKPLLVVSGVTGDTWAAKIAPIREKAVGSRGSEENVLRA